MERKKTNSEFIIDALQSGEHLRSPEITAKVSRNSGKDMKIQDIASILAKLSNSEKCDLGFFIQKKKTNKGYTYSLVPEAFTLPSESLYDLTRKTGKNRYTLGQAVEEYPELRKYVRSSRLKDAKSRKTARRGRKPAVHPEPGTQLAASTRRIRSTNGNDAGDQVLKDVLARFLEEISDQGGLNINVNLNVRFSGLGY